MYDVMFTVDTKSIHYMHTHTQHIQIYILKKWIEKPNDVLMFKCAYEKNYNKFIKICLTNYKLKTKTNTQKVQKN